MLYSERVNFCQQVALAHARDPLNISRAKARPLEYAASVALIYAATEAALNQTQSPEGIASFAALLGIPIEKLHALLPKHAIPTKPASAEVAHEQSAA